MTIIFVILFIVLGCDIIFKKRCSFSIQGAITIVVQKWKQKRKIWHDANLRKQLRLRHKKRCRKKPPTLRSPSLFSEQFKTNGAYKISAPSKFNLLADPDSSLKFFNSVIDIFSSCQPHEKIFFDFTQVEEITVDSIMYFIALLKNTWRIKQLKISCSGNLPLNVSARKIMEECGFYDYLEPIHSHPAAHNRRYVKISHGSDANGELAGNICDFANNACKSNLLNTKRLYPMIVELMTNTHQHAYGKKKSNMIAHWYIFVQELDDIVQFVFLDTGLGIPKTIFKHFRERAKNLLITSDAQYLESVLRGDFRTETRQKNRGKGLPGIYEDICKNSILDFSVISGKGKCSVQPDGSIATFDLNYHFAGTLFTWAIPKYEEGVHDNH